MPNPTNWLKSQKPLAGRWLSAAVAVGTLGGLLIIVQAWLLADIVNDVLFADGGLVEVQTRLWLLLGVFGLRAVLAWGAEQAAFRAAAQVKLRLRDRLFRHVQNLGPVLLSREHSGDLVNTLTDGIEALEAYFARYLPAVALMALVPLSILLAVFPFDWLSGLIMLGTAPLIPLFMILIGKGAERLNQKQWRKLARLSAHFLDVIRGLTTLKQFDAAKRETMRVAQLSDDYRRSTMRVLRLAFLSSLALEFFATVSIALVAVSIGFRLFWGEIQFFEGFFILLLAPEFYLPLRTLGTHYHARMDAVGAAERMAELFTRHPPKTAAGRLPSPSPAAVEIRFRDVGLTYPDGRTGLESVDFAFRPGEHLALVGTSGAGKSSIVNLLLGFATPTRGDIFLGDTPLDAFDAETWRHHLAWVPQSPRLFHGSIADNIRIGRPDADDQALKQAARLANAEAFVAAMPDGYDTLVGDGGRALSGGQIRRLALARAFLRDAPLVVLDEPTASLDAENEALVQAAIDALARNRTLLVIAHRLHTLATADRILAMAGGRIQEQGTHAELLAANGLYSRLVAAAEIVR